MGGTRRKRVYAGASGSGEFRPVTESAGSAITNISKDVSKFIPLGIDRAPAALPLRTVLANAFVSCFIVVVHSVLRLFVPSWFELVFIPPFYGSIVLAGFHDGPFCQPRNIIGGHTLSAICGYAAARAVLSSGLTGSVASAAGTPIALVTAVLVMLLTRTMHPPAAGTAIAAAGLANGVVGSVGLAFVLSRA